MNACAETNKSQQNFRVIAIMAAASILDVVLQTYMVVGCTKFDPDLLASSTAWEYNCGDVINQGMVLRRAEKFFTTQSYYISNLLH